jgi:hypothetical protein
MTAGRRGRYLTVPGCKPCLPHLSLDVQVLHRLIVVFSWTNGYSYHQRYRLDDAFVDIYISHILLKKNKVLASTSRWLGSIINRKDLFLSHIYSTLGLLPKFVIRMSKFSPIVKDMLGPYKINVNLISIYVIYIYIFFARVDAIIFRVVVVIILT